MGPYGEFAHLSLQCEQNGEWITRCNSCDYYTSEYVNGHKGGTATCTSRAVCETVSISKKPLMIQ